MNSKYKKYSDYLLIEIRQSDNIPRFVKET